MKSKIPRSLVEMSNRNFDASTIMKILKAQNAANNHNRFQTLTNSGVNQLAPNPQTEHFDADVVNQYNAGSQTYYFQGFPTMTYLSPINFPAIAPPIAGSTPTVVSIGFTDPNYVINLISIGSSAITDLGVVRSNSNQLPVPGGDNCSVIHASSFTPGIQNIPFILSASPIYTRAYAINSYGISYGDIIIL